MSSALLIRIWPRASVGFVEVSSELLLSADGGDSTIFAAENRYAEMRDESNTRGNAMTTDTVAATKTATKKSTTPKAPKAAKDELALSFSLGDDPAAEEPTAQGERAAARGGAHQYGAFSIEKFASAGGLTYTHEDAAGF